LGKVTPFSARHDANACIAVSEVPACAPLPVEDDEVVEAAPEPHATSPARLTAATGIPISRLHLGRGGAGSRMVLIDFLSSTGRAGAPG
jgi:hypothetical protein